MALTRMTGSIRDQYEFDPFMTTGIGSASYADQLAWGGFATTSQFQQLLSQQKDPGRLFYGGALGSAAGAYPADPIGVGNIGPFWDARKAAILQHGAAATQNLGDVPSGQSGISSAEFELAYLGYVPKKFVPRASGFYGETSEAYLPAGARKPDTRITDWAGNPIAGTGQYRPPGGMPNTGGAYEPGRSAPGAGPGTGETYNQIFARSIQAVDDYYFGSGIDMASQGIRTQLSEKVGDTKFIYQHGNDIDYSPVAPLQKTPGGGYLMPANWNTDVNGNDLPWGMKRQPNGRITMTGGAIPTMSSSEAWHRAGDVPAMSNKANQQWHATPVIRTGKDWSGTSAKVSGSTWSSSAKAPNKSLSSLEWHNSRGSSYRF